MSGKYKKSEAAPWQRRLVFILAWLSGITFLLFAAWAVLLFIEAY